MSAETQLGVLAQMALDKAAEAIQHDRPVSAREWIEAAHAAETAARREPSEKPNQGSPKCLKP